MVPLAPSVRSGRIGNLKESLARATSICISKEINTDHSKVGASGRFRSGSNGSAPPTQSPLGPCSHLSLRLYLDPRPYLDPYPYLNRVGWLRNGHGLLLF